MTMTSKEKLKKLRREMQAHNIDVYVIPMADFHANEYVGEHFKTIEWLSNFSGSAGTIIVTNEKAGLWTDGRYFIMAESQLKDSSIELYKMGVSGVPTVYEFILSELPVGGTLAFDGRVVSAQEGLDYEKIAQKKKAFIFYTIDLVNRIWTDRVPISNEKAFHLDIKYSGEHVNEKLNRIRDVMKKNKADFHIIASIDDIYWTLNMRGKDIEFSPLVLSYFIIFDNLAYLFVNKQKLNDDLKRIFEENKIFVKEYDDVYEFIKNCKRENTVLIDLDRINYSIYKSIPEKIQKIVQRNPTVLFKAI